MSSRSELDIDALNAFLERVRSYTDEYIWVGRNVKSIYHYTDLGGLCGIAEKHDLWLTHSRYSNDDEELTHGYGIVRDVIRARLADPNYAAQRAYLAALQAELEGAPPESVYVCCFCQDGDLLSQWRGYGANGAGVSLRFDPAEFAYITGPDSPQHGLIRLWSVIYDNERKRRIVENALDFGANDVLEVGVARAASAIRFFAPTFKNELFREENEVRLIFTPRQAAAVHPNFRVARGMLVPYFSLKELGGPPAQARLLPLQEVRIGPSASKELTRAAARMLLAKAGYAGVEVSLSAAPYRG